MISRGSAVSETPRIRSLESGLRSGKDDRPGLSHTGQESVKEGAVFGRVCVQQTIEFLENKHPREWWEFTEFVV